VKVVPVNGDYRSRAASNSWIISLREDLLWFQGSVVAGLALLVLFVRLGPLDNGNSTWRHPAVWALAAWGIFFDGTHVFGTYARSYLVRDDVSRANLPGRWSWAVLAVGPLIALADHFFFSQGPSQLAQAGLLFKSFLLFAYLWAYWHLVRQHYGFLVLYQRRAGTPPATARLETALLWAGCLYPYLRFSLSPAYQASGMIQTTPAALLAPLTHLLDGAAAVAGVTLMILLWLQREPPRLAARRWLFLAIVIGFHVLVFASLDNLLTITATLTLFHNLQYHRIVWQYERGLKRIPAGTLTRYLTLGILLGIAWYGPRVFGVTLARSDLARNLLLGLGWCVAFHHYLVDGRIWRVRRSPGVAQALDAGAR
jgi:hypothetical protein